MAFQRTAAEGPLLIADISGYTSFLTDVAVAHRDDAFANGAMPEAYGLMSSLLDGIVERDRPALHARRSSRATRSSLSRPPMTTFPEGEALLDWVRGCYAEFASRRRVQAGEFWTCTCDACARA